MRVLNRQGNLNCHDYTVHYLHCGIESANEVLGGSSAHPAVLFLSLLSEKRLVDISLVGTFDKI